MRLFSLPMFTLVLIMAPLSAVASQPAVNPGAAAGVKGIVFVAREVRPETKTIHFDLPDGGRGRLFVGGKTLIIKYRLDANTGRIAGREGATFASLHEGQRLHVWYNTRDALAMIVEVLPAKSGQSATYAAGGSSSSDWVSSYYRDPQPDRFVSEIHRRSKAGKLSTRNAEPPLVAFLSRVIAANPEKLEGWMAALADLPENDKETLHKAIWFSNTAAGKAYFQQQGLLTYLAEPAPDVVQIKIASPAVLDMLWGCFLATGDEVPVRRIVSAFNYYPYAGALERYRTSQRTGDDARQAHYNVILRPPSGPWAATAGSIRGSGKSAKGSWKAGI